MNLGSELRSAWLQLHSSLPAVHPVTVVWLLRLWVFLFHLAHLVLCPVGLGNSYYYNPNSCHSLEHCLSLLTHSPHQARRTSLKSKSDHIYPLHPSNALITDPWFAEYRADPLLRPKYSPWSSFCPPPQDCFWNAYPHSFCLAISLSFESSKFPMSFLPQGLCTWCQESPPSPLVANLYLPHFLISAQMPFPQGFLPQCCLSYRLSYHPSTSRDSQHGCNFEIIVKVYLS